MTTTAIVLAVVFVNLLVDVLAVMAVIGLAADEKAMAEETAAKENKYTGEPLGLLMDRKE